MKNKASHHLSPLRYPGGKGKLAPSVKQLIKDNGLLDRTYAEPFAGGAGIALALLMHGYARDIIINDLNPPVFAFWKSLIQQPSLFCERIESVDLTVNEWERQRARFIDPATDEFDLGFATFFLNRTNHSGVLNGGMIGGRAQSSTYNIDARFNRSELSARVRRISRYSDEITLSNLDAKQLISNLKSRDPGDFFLYADPPYVNKGPDLYYDFFKEDDHRSFAAEMRELPDATAWIVSYDNHPLVHELYKGLNSREYELAYSVKNGKNGREVMFFSDAMLDLTVFDPQAPSVEIPDDQAELVYG